MELEVGAILEGKVTGITKFGAFVSLPGGRSGLVHISEIAYSYVSDVSEFLSVGQEVKVKLISIDETGRINLSIKKTAPPPPRPANPRFQGGGRPASSGPRPAERPQSGGGTAPRPAAPAAQNRGQFKDREPQSFDDMLKQFMADSDSKISSIKQYSDHRTKSKRRQ